MSGERKGLYAEISERDFEFFKILCGERDRELLNGSAERGTEDFVRLVFLAAAFGFPGAVARLMDQAAFAGRAEEIKERLARAGEDFDAVDGWAEAFVSGIGIFRLRQLCGWLWQSRKKVFEKSGFDMFDLVFGEGYGISGYKS